LQERFLIIGADPGHTIGLCALDFEGKVLHLAHLEGKGIEGAVSIIEGWGTPSLIACDVSPAPEFITKLASYFNVKFYCPKKVLREEEKKKIAKKYANVQNAHERDALSAAIFAWRANQNTLRSALASNIDEKIKQKLCHLVLHGYNRNIALEILQQTPENQKSVSRPPAQENGANSRSTDFSGAKKENLLKLKEKNETLSELARINSSLQKRILSLENENLLLKQRAASLKGGAWGMLMREGEYRKLKAKNERLEARIRELAKKAQILSNKFSSANKKEKAQFAEKENMQIKKEKLKKGEKPHQKNTEEKKKQLQEKEKDGSKTTKNLKSLNPSDMLQRMVEQYRKSRSLQEK